MKSFKPNIRKDKRGRLVELFDLEDSGEVLFTSIRPGMLRGNHYHKRKKELISVIQGQAKFRLRNIKNNKYKEYDLTGDDLQVVEVLPYWTHNIENTGNIDVVFIEWASEPYDPENPDSFPENVKKDK